MLTLLCNSVAGSSAERYRIQDSTDNVLPADRRSTSALGEVLSNLVSVTCWPERKRVCRKDIGRVGRHSNGYVKHLILSEFSSV